MHQILPMILAGMLFVVTSGEQSKQAAARINRIDGSARILRQNSDQWRTARAGMSLYNKDQIYSQPESMVELLFTGGEIVRLDEETKIVIEESNEKKVSSSTALGNIWVNVRKLHTTGREFEMATPTAVAAIRGTVYHIATSADSSTALSVYNGNVAIGPTAGTKEKKRGSDSDGEIREVPGPEEIPGPYEVSLDQWLTITAGQRITVRSDGKYSQSEFDSQQKESNFIKVNIDLDSRLNSGK